MIDATINVLKDNETMRKISKNTVVYTEQTIASKIIGLKKTRMSIADYFDIDHDQLVAINNALHANRER